MKNAVKRRFTPVIIFTAVIFAISACNKPTVEAVYISMEADTAQVQLGQSIKFSAAVEGKKGPSQAVTWSVSSTADGTGAVASDTNISPNGTLYLSRTETAPSVYVRAASTQDAGKYDYVQINLASGAVTEGRQRRSRQGEGAQGAAQEAATAEPAVSGFTFSGGAITKYTGPGGAVNIPATINGVPVTSIGNESFYQNQTITSVIIPDGVKSIGKGAFSNCNSLASVTIPNGVTEIGGGAFMNCDNLTSVTIPDSVTSIGGTAFASTGLTSVTIPDSVTSIEQRAFAACKSLTSVTIGNGVTSIGYFPFEGCDSLATINVGAANTAYSSENGVLYDKAKIFLIAYPARKTDASFTIPSSVIVIQSVAFMNCESLTSVTIPSGVNSIGQNTFKGCINLTSVTFQSVVPSSRMHRDAFYRLGDLQDKYSAKEGGIGTYTRPNNGGTWTKQ